MANDKKFIVKNGLLTQETVVIGSTTDNGVNKLQVTGSSLFTQGTGSTPTISITNSGGVSNSIIAEFVGDSDSLQILNIGTGDYALLNSQQNNGIRFYDGTGGIEILYNGSVDIDFNSSGIDFKREPSYNGNVFWNAGNDGAGSGLDADLIDGLDSTQFLRSDESDTMTGDLTINGNLTVNGTTTYVNTETILLSDNILTLNANHTGAPTQDAGWEVNRGSSANSGILWDETNDWFRLNSAGTDLGRIITTADEGSGNGFDADTVDGLEAEQFLRSDVDDTAAGNITIQGNLTVGNNTAAGATIVMDGQAGNRYIFSNNGEIGFLNSAFAYAAYSDGSNNWRVLNDTYAKRFIDADNNSYLLDPAGTSVLNTIDLEGSIRHNGDTDTYINFNAANSFEVRTGGSQRLVVNDTAVTAVNQMRSPIYYDSDDITYYGNFAGSSRLNDISLVGQIIHDGDTNTYLDFNAADSFQVVTGGTARLTVTNSAVTASVDVVGPRFVDSDNNAYYANPASSSVFNTLGLDSDLFHNGDTDNKISFTTDTQTFTTGNVARLTINNTSVTGSVDFIAPRFVDSGNGSYYADFANAGVSIAAAGTINAANANFYNGGTSNDLNIGRNVNERFNFNVTDGIGYIRYYQDETDTTDHSVNFEIVSTSTGTNRFNFNADINAGSNNIIGGLGVFTTGVYAPVYYDLDNEIYYADFASTSVSINAAGTVRAGNGALATPAYTFGSDTNTGMYRFAADTIGFSTGGNDEFRIYTTYALAVGQMRSPIFYDSNNTAYYGNFASTSNMNRIDLDDYIRHRGDTDTYFGFSAADTIVGVTANTTRLTINTTALTSTLNTYAPRFYTNDYLVHTGDENTYIGFNAADTFGVWTGGANRLNIDNNSADFSINVYAPRYYDSNNNTYYIDPASDSVMNTIDLDDYIRHRGDTDTYFGFDAADNYGVWVANSQKFDISSTVAWINNVNVGIGTTTPSRLQYGTLDPRLHVVQTGTNGSYNLVARFEAGSDADNTGAAILINHSNDRGLLIEAGRESSDRAIAHLGLVVSSGTNTRVLSLKQDGTAYRVGINSENPAAVLDINNRVTMGANPFAIGNRYIRLGDGGTADFTLAGDSSRNVWAILEGSSQFVFTDTSANILLSSDAASLSVIVGDQTPTYTVTDNTSVIDGPTPGTPRTITDNKLHVNGSIQLNGNQDAIVFGRGTSTFLMDEELGFGWGGGFYMTEGTTVKIRNDKALSTGGNITAGNMYASRFYDSNNNAYYVDPNGDSQMNTIDIDDYIRHRGDTNTYIGFDANDRFRVWTAGTQRLNIDTNSADFSVNVYAPRYYDSNNNAYYVDPASTSIMSRIDLDDYIRHRGDEDNYFGFAANDTFRVWTGGVQRFNVDNNSADFAVNVYAPRYYDSNNNAYYVDPASTSILSNLTLNNTSGDTVLKFGPGVPASDDAHIEWRGASNAGVLRFSTSDDNGTESMEFGDYDLVNRGGTFTRWALMNRDYLLHTSDIRAPIFYDSNDTAYYGDFNGTSQMNRIDINDYIRHRGDTNTYIGFNAADTFRVVTGGTERLQVNNTYVQANNQMRAPIYYDSADTSYYWNPNTSSAHRFQTPSGYVDVGPQNTSYSHFQTDRPKFYFNKTVSFDGGGIEAYDGSATASFPIYYDWNDTFYYGNFAGFSRMNGITFGNPGNGTNTKGRWLSIEGNTDASGEGSARIFFAEHNSTTGSMDAYGMSLVYIGGSTSITSASGQPITVSGIGNGEWGLLGHNNNINGAWAMRGPRDASYVQASGSFRAPIFYDSNNTSYYGNFASTSIMNVVRANRFQVDGSTYIIDSPSGNYGSIRVDGAKGGWAGYAIRDDWVFMADGATNAGIYNDTDNEWAIRIVRNAGTDLYYNGAKQAETENGYFLATNQMRAPIYYDSNNTGYFANFASGNTSQAIKINGRIYREGFATGGGSNNWYLNAQDRNHFIWNTATNWGIFWATDTSASYRYTPFGDNMITFVGAGNTRAAIDLDNGNAYFQGQLYASNYNLNGGNENISLNPAYGSGLGDTMLFDGTEYWEKRVIQSMQGSENAATTVTGEFVKNNNAPVASSYVLRTSTYRTFDSDYIPVEPGEEIYGEIAVNYVSGSGGLVYMGVRRYDKDKNPIAGNDGITYFVASAANHTGGWTTFRGHTTIPTSHTPYNGSDGGGCKYVRVIVLMNYPNGTGPATREYGPPILKRSNHLSNIVTQNITAEGDVYANRYYDRNDVSYYVDPASTSIMNDVRANIFYDRGNTAYYLDPASTGTSLNVRGEIRNPSIWINDGDNNNNYNENIRLFNAPNGVSVIAFSASGTSGTPTTSILGYSDRLETRYQSNWQMRLYNNRADFVDDVRATVFYDRNDTTFYTDPASGSRFRAVEIRDQGLRLARQYNQNGIWFNAGTDSNHVLWNHYYGGPDGRGAAGSGGFDGMLWNTYQGLRIRGGSDGAYNIARFSTDGAGNGNGHYVQLYAQNVEQLGTRAGYGFAPNQMRSPIYYDSNNTAFYVDPASTSITNTMRANRFEVDSATYYIDTASGSYGSIRVVGNRNGYAGYAINDDWVFMSSGASIAGIYNDTNNEWAAIFRQNAEVELFYNGVEQASTRNGYFDALNQMRAPIYYDRNDTAYYVNPNSTSRLLNLDVVGNLTVAGYAQNNPVENQWYQTSTYVHDATNGTRYYWIRVGRTNNGGAKGILEYFAKDDVNYSGHVSGRVVISSWSSSSISVDHHTTSPNNSISPEVRIDNSNYLWLRMNGCTWDSWLRWHWIRADGITLEDGSTKIDSLGGAVPPNSSPTILPGQETRATLGNVTGTTVTNTTNYVGGLYSRSSVYGSIFYDTDNNSYYGDFASTSRLNTINVNAVNVVGGGIQQFYTSSGNIRGYIQATETNDAHLIIATSGGEDISFRDGGTGGQWNMIIRGDGNVLTLSGHYAQIFYDRNNTTYRGDFASTSVMNVLDVRGEIYNDGWFRNDVNGRGLYNTATTQHFYSDSDDGWNVAGGSNVNWIRFRDEYGGTIRGYVYADNGNNIGFLNNGGGWALRTNNSTTEVYGNLYANIMYDRNNTSYYVDPASTTQLNTLYVDNRIIFNGSVATDDNRGIFFSGSSGGDNQLYAIYRENGAWSNPYPDLRIAFHTGIKFGANSGYQGMRFYNDYNMSTQVMSINNGSDPLGGNNVYVNNSLQAGSSLRAPIFYDSNNTAYYIDPANSSQSANLLGDVYVRRGKIVVQAGSDSFTTYVEDDSTAAGRAQLLLQSSYSDLVVMSREANNNGHGSTITLATQETTTNNYAKWVIGQGQYNQNRDILSFSYGVNITNPHSVMGTNNANADMLIIDGGRVDATGQMRAPILYDRNNTGFYVDPNSTSNLNQVLIDNLRIDGTTAGIYTNNTYLDIRYGSTGGGGIRLYDAGNVLQGYWYGNGSGEHGFLDNDGAWAHRIRTGSNSQLFYTNGNLEMQITTSYVEAYGSSRAPIFYDSNNTGYYGNFASTSRLNTLRTNRLYPCYDQNTGVYLDYPTGNYGSIQINGSGNGGWEGYSINGRYVFMSADDNRVGIYNDVDNEWMIYATRNAGVDLYYNGSVQLETENGYGLATNQMRAPIYYDSNDTNYYVNPSSFSNLNTGVRGTNIYARNWLRNDASGSGLTNDEDRNYFYSQEPQEWRLAGDTDGSGISLRGLSSLEGTNRFWVYGDSNGQGFLNSGGQWVLQITHADGSSPGIKFREQANETWTGNPGSDVGKIEYHANRFYIVAGSNSDRIVQFRRDGTNVSYIANDGVFHGTATSARWADLAERYEADAIYEPGTVLGIGGDKEVTLYQPGMPLAGAISTKPAYRMNDDNYGNDDSIESKMNPFVALKGRIPVKINGSAKKGQWIIADKDGKGRAVDFRTPGINSYDIIGIALEDGENEVEVKI